MKSLYIVTLTLFICIISESCSNESLLNTQSNKIDTRSIQYYSPPIIFDFNKGIWGTFGGCFEGPGICRLDGGWSTFDSWTLDNNYYNENTSDYTFEGLVNILDDNIISIEFNASDEAINTVFTDTVVSISPTIEINHPDALFSLELSSSKIIEEGLYPVDIIGNKVVISF